MSEHEKKTDSKCHLDNVIPNSEDEENELEYEPEWCEECAEEFESSDIEYEFNYDIVDGCAYCSHCGKPL